jgi:uncharacterized protein (TIGR00369 family)
MSTDANGDIVEGQTIETLQADFERMFAPWVQDLRLTVTDADRHHVTLVMQPDTRLSRYDGIVSGQALMAAADTAMVLAIWSASGQTLPCATVDMNTSFLKPATNVELTVTADIIRRGRSLAFARAGITSSADGKPVVTATGTYTLPGGVSGGSQ